MMAEFVDRRRTPRAELRGSATVHLPDQARFDAAVLDVGVGGMALRTRDGAPRGFMRIRFKLGPESPVFDVAGRVVRERLGSDHSVWGIQFHSLDLGTKIRLRDYVVRTQRLGRTV
jgi:c-di-GMP-binding flagellar brake protein YcgR